MSNVTITWYNDKDSSQPSYRKEFLGNEQWQYQAKYDLLSNVHPEDLASSQHLRYHHICVSSSHSMTASQSKFWLLAVKISTIFPRAVKLFASSSLHITIKSLIQVTLVCLIAGRLVFSTVKITSLVFQFCLTVSTSYWLPLTFCIKFYFSSLGFCLFTQQHCSTHLARLCHLPLRFRAAVLKCFGLRTPLHFWKLMRTKMLMCVNSIYHYSLY